MPEQQQPIYKRWPKAIWEQFCEEFSIFFSMAVSNLVLVDGVQIDSLDHVSHFGVCDTAANVQTKTISIPQYNLITGAKVIVKFENTNTVANPTLNVSNTGARPIIYKGTSIPTEALSANSVREFVFDGTNYLLIGDLVLT